MKFGMEIDHNLTYKLCIKCFLIRYKHGNGAKSFKLIRQISSYNSSSLMALLSSADLRLLNGLLPVCSVF